MIYIALIVGCLLLYKGGNYLLDGMLGIGQKFGLPKAIIGLVLVSLGTSAPELFVSVGASLQDHGGMAAGNVIGSNIINISIVLGLAVCMVVLPIQRVFKYQLFAVSLLSLLTLWLLGDGQVARLEGLSLIIFMLVSFLLAFRFDAGEDSSESVEIQGSHLKLTLLTVAGIALLLIGAESLIWGGLALAERIGLSETIIALTVTALGTSLPEIAASIVALTRRETSLVLGNVIGSNLLNLGLVLGVSAAIRPLNQVELTHSTQIYFAALILFISALSLRPGHLGKWVGYLLMATYLLYVGLLITS